MSVAGRRPIGRCGPASGSEAGAAALLEAEQEPPATAREARRGGLGQPASSAARMFSSRCATDEVPGIGSITGER